MDIHATAAGLDLSGLTDAAVRFVAGLGFAKLTAAALHLSSRCIIDGLGVMLAGFEQPGMAPLDRFVAAEGGTGKVRMLATRAGFCRRQRQRFGPGRRATRWTGTTRSWPRDRGGPACWWIRRSRP
ncbi:MAG TPA: hypothetical protein ENH55_14920 [Aurantimonas coralicida]|uniref:Uncharacterized protein n=1 Tax=Aurantimonas coralicida TaxID=182270 RepID=A0A9C9TGU8_9HYPH|nr:hypothetical protein [Aurantimonas coralicida]HEU00617.1 hypothetical protein [Aurantimonas coralicida]